MLYATELKPDGVISKFKITGNLYHAPNNPLKAIFIKKSIEMEGEPPQGDSMMKSMEGLDLTVENDKLLLKNFDIISNIDIRNYDAYINNKAQLSFKKDQDNKERIDVYNRK